MYLRSVNNLRTIRSYYAKPNPVPRLTSELIVDFVDEILAARKEVNQLKREVKYWRRLTHVRHGGERVND